MVTSTNAVLTVIAATPLEAGAVRRAVPGVRVVETGVGLTKAGADLYDLVVSCGLAGGLRNDVPTGTIVIPREVGTSDGKTITCDPRLSAALVSAALQLGHSPSQERLLTSSTLVTGDARRDMAERGFIAADMETGLLRARALAAVRVVLDTPQQELSAAWLRPATAVADPRLWPQALWLWREAPRCARLAAAVLALAITQLNAA